MKNVIIIHGTEGNPRKNWYPWLKEELEKLNYKVEIPQFPSPPVVPAKISEWYDVLKNYKLEEDSILVGHSLGGVFVLRILELIHFPIEKAIFVATPTGIETDKNYERDRAFSGFDFDWEKIKKNAKNFSAYYSDNDPYVSILDGEILSQKLRCDLKIMHNVGHFNARMGCNKIPELLVEFKEFGIKEYNKSPYCVDEER